MNFIEQLIRIQASLDSIGFDYGTHRVSLYRGLLVLLVLMAIYLVGRYASRVVRLAFRRLTRLDATEQLLGEKLVGIVVWLACIHLQSSPALSALPSALACKRHLATCWPASSC
jgi:hypothetical protein